jgi:hypothetical protein
MIGPPTAAPPGNTTSTPPDPWPTEDLCAFRESILHLVTPEPAHKVLRQLGEKFAELIRELAPSWSWELGSSLAWDVRAGLGELRQAQGYLTTVGEAWKSSHLQAEDILLSQAVEVEARALSERVARLEGLLARHRAETAAEGSRE